MFSLRYFFRLFIVFLINHIVQAPLYSQGSKNNGNDVEKFFFVSADYFSNSVSFGQLNPYKTEPGFSLSGSYSTDGIGISAGITSFFANDSLSASKASFTADIGLSYEISLTEWLDVTPSYTRFFGFDTSNLLANLFNDDFSLTINAFPKSFFASLSAHYYLGDEQNAFIMDASAGYSFLIPFEHKFFTGLSIDPTIMAIFGDQEYFSDWFRERVQNDSIFRLEYLNSKEARELKEEILANASNLERRIYINNPRLLNLQVLLLAEETKQYEKKFNLNSVQCFVPFSLYLGNYITLNLSYSLYIPTFPPDYVNTDAQHFFSAGISFFK